MSMLYRVACLCNAVRAGPKQARRRAGYEYGTHGTISTHDLNIAEIDVPAPGLRCAMRMEADLAESLPGIGRKVHSSEMGHTLDGVGMDDLAVLVHSPAIIGASHSFAAGETYFYSGHAAHALPLVEIQDVTALDDVSVQGKALNSKVGRLPAAGGAVIGKNMHGIILNSEGDAVAYLTTNRDHDISGLGASGDGD